VSPAVLLDPLLALAVVATAWRALAARDLFAGVVLYVAFGLLVTLAWVRLEAPDVALAEGAIGVGVTAALLLDAVGHFRDREGGGG
jgi:energy-converting hydrogenase B subunit D